MSEQAGAGAPVVEAAGGVLWRLGDDGRVEVALVHRPRYDDWSLPKGKLTAGEHPLLGALREIEEETGFAAVPGRPLGEQRYLAAGRPKRVRYWACRAGAGTFRPGAEVDELRWIPPDEAAGWLTAGRDLPLLERFTELAFRTRPLLVVRHASAGDRDAWNGDDRDRPLDELGRAQAVGLVEILRAYGVHRAATADVRRCRDTLGPFSAATGVPVAVEPAVTVGRFEAEPDRALRAALDLGAGAPAVLCGQREVIPSLVARLCEELGAPVTARDVGEPDKGATVVLHLSGSRLVAREMLPPAG